MLKPKKIKVEKEDLRIEWNDGKLFKYPLKFVRDESPDAENKGETILWRQYDPPPKGPDKPGKYEISDIEVVGNYGISIKWKDGYDYGIYSFELLRVWGEYFEVKDNSHLDFDNHDH